MSSDDLSLWGTIGAVVGSGVLGSFLRGWWAARASNRADAVDAANAKGQINMLADFERRAKEAEADADNERAARLAAQREQLKAEKLQADAERDLRMAHRDLQRLRRRLKAAGVPDSDWMADMETNFGALPPPPSP